VADALLGDALPIGPAQTFDFEETH